jgi:hypothetical protein
MNTQRHTRLPSLVSSEISAKLVRELLSGVSAPQNRVLQFGAGNNKLPNLTSDSPRLIGAGFISTSEV